jgi:threonine/homoserine/homoserine lactone efflux protein
LILQSIGVALPAALAVALSPFPVIGIVLMLAGRSGRRNGPVFAFGWVVGLAAVITLVAIVFGGADDPDSTSSAIADWGRVVAGAAMIVVGIKKWFGRPRRGDAAKTPEWMSSLDDATAQKALTLGLVLSALNPKNFILAANAATSMIELGAEGSDLVVGLAAFVVVGSITVLGAVVAKFAGGRAGATLLDAVREFMVENSTVISVLILIILGGSVLGGGLTGLGR